MRKVDQVAQELREDIEAGRLGPGTRAPSEYELASRFAVNKTTANKAVAQLVAAGLLVRGKRGAGTFVKRGLMVKGAIMYLGGITSTFHSHIVHGAQKAALSRGYLMYLATPRQEQLFDFVRGLDRSHVLGILTCQYGRLESSDDIPLLHVDNDMVPDQGLCSVRSDSVAGARMATKVLLDAGHREIAYLGQSSLPTRRQGFIEAALDAGISDAENRALTCDSAAAVLRTIPELKRRFPKLTGVVCGTDHEAFALVKYGRQANIRVPEDLSLVSFGNLPQISDLLGITSVEQHPEELGVFAAERLIDTIEGKYTGEPFLEMLPCEIVHRQSIQTLEQRDPQPR